MATKTQLETLWNVPDELRALIAPVPGSEKAAGIVGRPPRPNRQIFDGILYVLRTGCQWHALSRKLYGPASTVHAGGSSVGKRRSPTISRWFNWPPLSVSSVYQRCTHDLFLYRLKAATRRTGIGHEAYPDYSGFACRVAE